MKTMSRYSYRLVDLMIIFSIPFFIITFIVLVAVSYHRNDGEYRVILWLVGFVIISGIPFIFEYRLKDEHFIIFMEACVILEIADRALTDYQLRTKLSRSLERKISLNEVRMIMNHMARHQQIEKSCSYENGVKVFSYQLIYCLR